MCESVGALSSNIMKGKVTLHEVVMSETTEPMFIFMLEGSSARHNVAENLFYLLNFHYSDGSNNSIL